MPDIQEPGDVSQTHPLLSTTPPPPVIPIEADDQDVFGEDFYPQPLFSDEDTRGGWRKSLKQFLSFVGPGYMVAVGYLDPGNWATDLAAGSQFGYRLLFIVFLSNAMAVLLQSLCIKLGVVTGRDLAQACRKYFNPYVNIFLYILCEAAIIATDIAEVVGTAIALNLLFGWSLPFGVVITSLDVLLMLAGWKVQYLKVFEWLIISLVFACAICFTVLIRKSEPDWWQVAAGYLPSTTLFTEKGALYIAMGIIGATVMPHNLYLHSSIVKYRSSRHHESLGDIHEIDDCADDSDEDERQPLTRKANLPITLKWTNLDSAFALTFALAINSAILIVAAATFFKSGQTEVADLKDAFLLLKKHLGDTAAVLFAVALLFAGQSSTITGTMAGQIVMIGFFGSSWRVKPWIRRLVTRVLAIAPSMAVAVFWGERGINDLLVFSQVVLSIQLPFAVWPLVYFTSSKRIMTVKYVGAVKENNGAGYGSVASLDSAERTSDTHEEEETFSNNWPMTILAIFVAVLITLFNIVLLVQVATGQT
ncbi:hypothetical protein HK104_008914 [Borealophlyctis nickersoniae]|nr:hypothetical protein HK104_008914 [Borealophlyctis nickersoniae]